LKITKHNFLLILFFLSITFAFAQNPKKYKKGAVLHRLSGGIVKSFYKNNPYHTVETKSLIGYCATYKAEIIMDRKTNILIGLEYFNQGVSFKGYYAKPGSTYLYDGSYAYTHELRVQEFQLPLALKIALKNEKDHFYSSYFFVGAGVRYIYKSYAVISNDSTGITVFDGNIPIKFEHPGEGAGINTYLHGGLGLQHNFRDTGGALFFEMTYKYGFSRLHYQGNKNTNDLYIKDSHLEFTLGFRF
jgi:hypothetical protein